MNVVFEKHGEVGYMERLEFNVYEQENEAGEVSGGQILKVCKHHDKV